MKHQSFCSRKPNIDGEIELLAILIKNQNRTMFRYISLNFRMCTIVIETLTPLDRTLRIKSRPTTPTDV